MLSHTIVGFAARAKGQALSPFEYAPPPLKPQDVRVAVTHCGVCHTDIQAIDNYYGITGYPFVPGHEIVGTVSELGPAVEDFAIGDRVGIGWQGRSCGECEWCVQGETQLCMHIEDTTVMVPYGGFSTSVVADYHFVYKIPEGLPAEFAAVLMCAGLTVYKALQPLAARPNQKVAILGVGGLGHLAIQFAHALGFEVTAISSSPNKITQALAFGADRFIDSNDTSGMRAAEYSQDVVVCTSNAGIPWGPVMMALKKHGQMVLLGFPDLDFNSTDLVAHELTICGSLIGNPPTMRAMLAFAQQHHITPQIELMPMTKVNAAIQKVKDNQARYRIVLTNDLGND